jgi:hypothetical protein
MKATTPELRIMAIGFIRNKTTNDLGVATNSCTTHPGDQEAMIKATVRPRRVGRLTKYHRAYSAAMTSIVALRHTMPRHGHKTMTTTMPKRTPQDDITCKPS